MHVSVWQVSEWVHYEVKAERLMDSFVLATSAAEALEITGNDENRRVVTVHEVLTISKMRGEKYKIVPVS